MESVNSREMGANLTSRHDSRGEVVNGGREETEIDEEKPITFFFQKSRKRQGFINESDR